MHEATLEEPTTEDQEPVGQPTQVETSVAPEVVDQRPAAH